MSGKNKSKANVDVDDHRNIVCIDIGKRKHTATAMTPQGAVIASLNVFENNKESITNNKRLCKWKVFFPFY